jgi:hypothetical protein
MERLPFGVLFREPKIAKKSKPDPKTTYSVGGTPRVVRRILADLGLPTEPSDPCPSRPPPGRTGDLFAPIPA